MKYPILFRLALFFVCPLSLCGCYYAIPTIVEAVNQNRLQSESEGAILESNTGALKFVSNSDKITGREAQRLYQGIQLHYGRFMESVAVIQYLHEPYPEIPINRHDFLSRCRWSGKGAGLAEKGNIIRTGFHAGTG